MWHKLDFRSHGCYVFDWGVVACLNFYLGGREKKSKRGFIQGNMLEMLVSKVLELLGGNFFQYFGWEIKVVKLSLAKSSMISLLFLGKRDFLKVSS